MLICETTGYIQTFYAYFYIEMLESIVNLSNQLGCFPTVALVPFPFSQTGNAVSYLSDSSSLFHVLIVELEGSHVSLFETLQVPCCVF